MVEEEKVKTTEATTEAAETTAGLIPVIAQSVAGEVMMMGYANREAFNKSFDVGKLTFWSRT